MYFFILNILNPLINAGTVGEKSGEENVKLF